MKLVLAALIGLVLTGLALTLARHYELRGSAPRFILYRILTRPAEPGFTVYPTPSEPVEREPVDFFVVIQSALKAGRYAELDSMATQFRDPRERFVSGIPKLKRFYDALGAFGPPTGSGCGFVPASVSIPPGFIDAEQRLEAWRRADPTSIAADLALANIWLESAWDARGGGFADEVTDAEWTEAGNRLSQAELYMIDPDPAADPEVYYLWIEIGKLRGYDRARLDRLYRRAVAQFPEFYPYYSQRVGIVETKWYGAPGELARYLDDLRRPGRDFLYVDPGSRLPNGPGCARPNGYSLGQRDLAVPSFFRPDRRVALRAFAALTAVSISRNAACPRGKSFPLDLRL